MDWRFWLLVGVSLWAGSSTLLLCLEYRNWKQGRGDTKMGNPLGHWYLYYVTPLILIAVPFSWINHWWDKIKQNRLDLAEYERSGLLSWFYVERRLKKDVKLTSALRGVLHGSYLCDSNVEFRNSVISLIREWLVNTPPGTSYGFSQVSDQTILGLIGNCGYRLDKGLSENGRHAEVSIAKPLPTTLTHIDLIESYYDRHYVGRYITTPLLCGTTTDRE